MLFHAPLQDQPLSEAELDRLTGFLASRGDQVMDIEELDGFLAALVAGPEIVLPSEYLPVVWGGGAAEISPFAGADEAREMIGLILRHSNGIAANLRDGGVHLPILLEDEAGAAQGNRWACGFLRGTEMRKAGWAQLLRDEEYCDCLIPMMMLYFEHDENPEMRAPPIGRELREDLFVRLAAGVSRAFRYFRRRAATPAQQAPGPGSGKVGRNERCPCGSGKKYKRCCGGAAVH